MKIKNKIKEIKQKLDFIIKTFHTCRKAKFSLRQYIGFCKFWFKINKASDTIAKQFYDFSASAKQTAKNIESLENTLNKFSEELSKNASENESYMQ